MIITIGEIVNKMLEYTTSLGMSRCGPFPVLTAGIGGSTGTTKIHIYIMQTAEHVYAATVTDDVYNGNRFVPTPDSSKPFVREKHFLSIDDAYRYESTLNIKSDAFNSWFYKQLYEFDIIRFNPDNRTQRVSDIGFNSLKIRRTIDRTFKSHHCIGFDMGELIDLVHDKHKTFDLTGLAEKELKCIYAKLKNYGLELTIQDNKIIAIEYERRS